MTSDARVTAIRDEWEAFAELLAAADERDLDRATRCAGWQVRDLVEHVLWGTSMETEALLAAVAGDPTPAVGQQSAVSDLASARALLAGRLGALAAATTAVATAAPVSDRSLLVPLQAATVPLPVALDILLLEAGTHTDDLRHALTGRSRLTPAVVSAVFAVLPAYLPTASVAATSTPDAPVTVAVVGETVAFGFRYDGAVWQLVAAGPPVGAPRTRGEDADLTLRGSDEQVALLLLGRSDGSEMVASGARDLAVDLKRWLPGP